MQDYRLADGDREVTFHGKWLASSTSDDGKAQRWTELALYRTDAGRYVLHKIGRSAVFHAVGSTCSKDAQPMSTAKMLDLGREDDIPCLHCAPSEDDRTVLVERDRYSVALSETPLGVLEALYKRDNAGRLSLHPFVQHLIKDACDADEDMAAAWRLQPV